MPAPLELLPKFAPIVARHFAAYLELFADEAAELGTHVARRVVAIIVALLALSFTLALACVWVLNAVWDTPWRQFAIVALLVVFAAATAVAWITATKRPVAAQGAFHRLRTEWTLDQQLIVELMDAKYNEDQARDSSSEGTEPARPVHTRGGVSNGVSGANATARQYARN